MVMVKCCDGRNCVKSGGWVLAPLWDHIERPVLGNEARHQAQLNYIPVTDENTKLTKSHVLFNILSR